MGFQSFRGAGQAGVVGTTYAEPYATVLVRCGEIEVPAVESVRETLREVVAGRAADDEGLRGHRAERPRGS
jgi:hypothetical protein